MFQDHPDWETTSASILNIRNRGLADLDAWYELAALLEAAPVRLPGSDGAESAVQHSLNRMTALGLDNVHLEETTVPHWERGTRESLTVVAPASHDPLKLTIAAVGGSTATPLNGLEAPVVLVKSYEELESETTSFEDAIVFLDPPAPWGELDPFAIYGALARCRFRGPSLAARRGASALLIRSITTRRDDNPHTGMLRYLPEFPAIPAAALGYESADRLRRLLETSGSNQQVILRLMMNCQTLEPRLSHNVVGEITGTKYPHEVIVLGGHLDSWDLGPGAHDDAAGCIQALEALNLIRKTGIRPSRTIRAVFFMNEEFGGTGGVDYMLNPMRKNETTILAVESDRGAFSPRGFSVALPEEQTDCWNRFLPLLRPVGIEWFKKGGSGVDIHRFEEMGTVCMGYVPDSQRYMDVHHSANDTLQSVNPRELELGALAMASLALVASELAFEPPYTSCTAAVRP